MRVLRSPVWLFLVLGVLTVVAIVIGTQRLAGQAAADEALSEARRTTEVLARSVAQPDLPEGLVRGNKGAIDRVDRSVLERLQVRQVRRIIIWKPDGTIVYSNAGDLIDQQVPLDAARRRALQTGETGSRIVRPGGGLSGSSDGAVQTFTRMRSPQGEPLLFEAHYSLGQIEVRRQEIFDSFRLITLGPPLLLIAVVTLMLSLLTRQLTRAGHERERLLSSAIDASDAERRRIARDLHDGVVQDLAGTAYSVSALARAPQTPPSDRGTLAAAGASLRDGLTALRSLLAEIHPPELGADGLAPALDDLVAPAARSGIHASVSVSGAEGAPDETVALVWRVAQEAVRNAIRHSRASTLAVTVRGEGPELVLEVVDDGVGFDPAAARDRGQYGLRGLRSLVNDCGGRLQVRSSPGEGTTVRMDVRVARGSRRGTR